MQPILVDAITLYAELKYLEINMFFLTIQFLTLFFYGKCVTFLSFVAFMNLYERVHIYPS